MLIILNGNDITSEIIEICKNNFPPQQMNAACQMGPMYGNNMFFGPMQPNAYGFMPVMPTNSMNLQSGSEGNFSNQNLQSGSEGNLKPNNRGGKSKNNSNQKQKVRN